MRIINMRHKTVVAEWKESKKEKTQKRRERLDINQVLVRGWGIRGERVQTGQAKQIAFHLFVNSRI